MTRSDWAELVRTTLRELGGDRTLVPGAKLKQRLLAALEDSKALDSHLDASGQRFSDFLERIEGLQVKKRVGTDMLVGLEGAAWPTTSPGRAPTRQDFRQDVYEALTRITSTPHYYVPSTDEFRPARDEYLDAIPLPLVTLQDLINQRQQFAESLAEPSARAKLLESLKTTANPLGNFQRELAQARLADQWHHFKFNLLFAQLNEWATAQNVAASPAWYESSGEYRKDSPQQILAKLAQYMSEQEVRNLAVPFRAVEALYRALTKKPFG